MPASPSVAPSPSPEPTPGRAVAFETEDGVRIAGRVFGNGRTSVVLGHQIDGDQRDWWDFAELLADEGYRALTIDFRSYCPEEGAGCSGDGTTGDAWRDLVAGARWLRGRGADRVVVIGASMGGTAAVVAASEGGADVDGVVALSAPVECCGMIATPASVGGIDVPSLFIAGRLDGDAPTSARQLARWAGPSGEGVILDSGEHGVDLLGGLAATDIERRTRSLILGFLTSVAG